jgi:hypothetical protein
MINRKAFKLAIACALFLMASLVPVVRAQDIPLNGRQTFVTFSEPVQVPGTVLEAGTYQFRVLDSTPMGNQGLVQISNREGTRVFATIQTIPACYSCWGTPTEHTVITFKERPANAPLAIREWVYPGDTYGFEFAYPRDEAERLSAVNHVKVPVASGHSGQ